MSSNIRREPEGQVLTTAALTGSLAMLLAVGLETIGVTTRIDATLARTLAAALGATHHPFPQALPESVHWLGTAAAAYGTSLMMLAVPGTWRRVLLWCGTLTLIAGWAPVLALASRPPEIATATVACLWSGLCSLVYARSRQMPCERPHHAPTTPGMDI